MNALANFFEAGFLQAEWAERTGWALLHSLWQGLLAGAILYLLLRRTSAARPTGRYLLTLTTMLIVPLACLFTWAGLAYQPPTMPPTVNAANDLPTHSYHSSSSSGPELNK